MIAVVFPGQGSQKPGMGQDLRLANVVAQRVFEEVSEAVGLDVAALCFESDEETLRRTDNAQIALFTVGVAAWRAFEDLAAPDVAAMAGHSVGEYAALVASGSLPIAVAARLVRTRGQLMAKAGEVAPGTMAAVLGLERDPLEAICAEAEGIVVVANDNCPGQLVISGEVDAVRRAGELATERGAKRVLPLNVSGAFHSPLMESSGREMAAALEGVEFSAEAIPVYSNVLAEPSLDMERWPRLLEEQLWSPVRWTETIQNMARDGIGTFVECGSGEVLSGLARRIDKSLIALKVNDMASLAETAQALQGA
jgi:[acyl-carrier-protein] S-malonyltransferase